MFQTNTSLKTLDLSHNWLDEQAGLYLGPSIASNEWLERLDLSWNHLRHKGAFSVALSLKVLYFLPLLTCFQLGVTKHLCLKCIMRMLVMYCADGTT